MNDSETRERLDDHWREIARTNWKSIKFFEGIKELLEGCKSKGLGVHILTLRDRESTEKVLKSLNLFSFAVCPKSKVN